jgi:hypothetical protein
VVSPQTSTVTQRKADDPRSFVAHDEAARLIEDDLADARRMIADCTLTDVQDKRESRRKRCGSLGSGKPRKRR